MAPCHSDKRARIPTGVGNNEIPFEIVFLKQARGGLLCVPVGQRIAGYAYRPAPDKPIEHPAGIVEGILRLGIRQAMASLQASRHQRKRPSGWWPASGTQTADPDLIEFHTGRFQRSQQLHQRALGFGLKHGLTSQRHEPAQRLGHGQRGADEFKPGQVVQQFAPAIDKLEGCAIQRIIPGPVEAVQRCIEENRPEGRRFAPRQLRPELVHSLESMQPVARIGFPAAFELSQQHGRSPATVGEPSQV